MDGLPATAADRWNQSGEAITPLEMPSPFRCRFRTCPAPRLTRAGFSLVEMMTVVAILLMAFGLMVPSLADFFRNRALDRAGQEFTQTFLTARLQAVVNRRPFQIVFFREGPRIYDVKLGNWKADDGFDPRTAAAADPLISFDLNFADRHSEELPRYSEWSVENERAAAAAEEMQRKAARRRRAANQPVRERPRVVVDDLIAVTFQRDGTLRLRAGSGSDVPSALFRKDPPEGADIVVRQVDNDYAAFIDIQPTGTVKSRIEPTALVPPLKARDDPEEAEAKR